MHWCSAGPLIMCGHNRIMGWEGGGGGGGGVGGRCVVWRKIPLASPSKTSGKTGWPT